MMRVRTWFKISGRSVVPQKGKHFHFDHLCTFVCHGEHTSFVKSEEYRELFDLTGHPVRIIFIDMFNDIEWWTLLNESK